VTWRLASSSHKVASSAGLQVGIGLCDLCLRGTAKLLVLLVSLFRFKLTAGGSLSVQARPPPSLYELQQKIDIPSFKNFKLRQKGHLQVAPVGIT
jgi:hypothetical protein